MRVPSRASPPRAGRGTPKAGGTGLSSAADSVPSRQAGWRARGTTPPPRGGRRGRDRGDPRHGPGVAGIREQDDPYPLRPGAEEVEQLVVRDRPLLLEIVGTEAFVRPVRLVPVLVGDEGAVSRELDEDAVSPPCSRDDRFDRFADRFPGRLPVDQLLHGIPAVRKSRGPVVRVVDASGEVAAGAGVVVDPDAQRPSLHGGSPWGEFSDESFTHVRCHGTRRMGEKPGSRSIAVAWRVRGGIRA